MRLLLDHGADVNVKGSRGTALKTASSEGHTEIVRLLLESPVEVNIKNDVGNTALMDASRGGHLGIVRLLLNHDQDVDVKKNAGNTALMYASRGGHVRVVELLKAAGAKD
ncbi:MAG TPA: ankyrin repeat domain-containing protein [Candidatus Latescibacteria bacterium]|nr:ankyrin repeat domain-containing protein [Candidatus Latescibacterota bacterium]